MSSRTDDIFASPLRRTARRAQTRAGLTRWLSYVALAVAAGLGLTFAVELGLFKSSVVRTAAPLAPVENPNQVTGGPSKISGFDKNNLPFEITAQKGVQDEKVESIVHLQTVDSVFARPNGASLNITSKGAVYETKTKALDLVGDVVFAEGRRFVARMDKAAVNMDDQTLASQSPVDVDIIGGNIKADSLTISANGERILFRGGVKARFVTQKGTSGDGE